MNNAPDPSESPAELVALLFSNVLFVNTAFLYNPTAPISSAVFPVNVTFVNVKSLFVPAYIAPAYNALLFSNVESCISDVPRTNIAPPQSALLILLSNFEDFMFTLPSAYIAPPSLVEVFAVNVEFSINILAAVPSPSSAPWL